MLRSTRKKPQKRNHAKRPATPRRPLQVDGHVVAEIIAAWTGIPLGKMGVGVRPMAALTVARQSFGGPRGWSRTARLGLRWAGSLLPARRSSPAPDRHDPTPIIRRPSGERLVDEINTVLNLKPLLKERVIGQDHALEAVAQRVRTARANLEDPNKPKGVFMFVGPSGVGKTETALALADILYGGERKLVTINMSEYQEAHSVSGLKGSPPGYVGYGEGGVLTEAVRRNPYSVVLLDEVEKAHPDVLELFFQVFDKGVLDDAEGREIDFRNTLIILTSNVGSRDIMQSWPRLLIALLTARSNHRSWRYRSTREKLTPWLTSWAARKPFAPC